MDPFYPVNDFDPLMKGMVIGGMGIVHVFLAQFAIGGGMLLTWLEWRAHHRADFAPDAEPFLAGFFRALVLVSFVLGALTGVGMWFTTIQVSAPTIGLMVDTFHWIWAIEWTFFCLEIAAGYAYYRYRARLGYGLRVRLLLLYSVGGWFSLFWINGILSWQLTPGRWLESGNVWAGFFNPSFWPSLLFRTVAALALAALVALAVVNALEVSRERRERLVHVVARPLLPMVLMPLLAMWYVAAMPPDSRQWVLGGSPAMTLFLALGAGASLLVGIYAVAGLVFGKLYVNGATATLLIALAFAATAGGEFVREGSRKPYTVRETLYANAITPGQVETLRRTGSVRGDPYPLRDAERYPGDQVRLGARVFRRQCSVCHTVAGANGVVHLTASWTRDQKRLNLAQLQRTKPFMPPFAGTAEELEALVQWLEWHAAGEPDGWPASENPGDLARIRTWIREAG